MAQILAWLALVLFLLSVMYGMHLWGKGRPFLPRSAEITRCDLGEPQQLAGLICRVDVFTARSDEAHHRITLAV